METKSPAPHHLPGPGASRERFFRLLAESIPEIVFTASPEGSCDYVNGRFSEYTGLPRERCLGFGWAEVLHPDDAARARDLWGECSAAGRTYEIEYRLRGKDGGYRWFLGRAEPLLDDDDGRVLNWFGTCTDIHDRKTAADRNLRLAAESARLGYWEWDVAADRVTWSDHLERISGTSSARFGGTFEGFLGLVHPDDRGRVEAAVRKALDDGTPYEEEFRLANPDGTFRWGLTRGQVYYDRHGRPERMAGIEVDVTDRKRAEEALRAREERFRLAALASQGLVYDWDPATGAVERYGRVREITGYAPEEADLTGQWWQDRVHPDDLGAANAEAMRALSAGEERFAITYRFRHRDGHWVDVEDNSLALRGADGSVVRVIGCSFDVTAGRRAEQALRDSEEFARRLADVAPSILYVYDLEERRNVWGNREMTNVLGYTRAQIDAMAGDLLGTLLHPDDLERYRGYFERLVTLGEGEALTFEYRMRHADGSWRWLSSRDMAFRRGPDGRVTQILGAASDVTDWKRVEGELRASERVARATFENAAVGIARVAPDGRWLDVNETLCRFLGHPRDELLALTFAAVTHPEDLDADWAHARRLLAGEGTTYSMEKRYVRKDRVVVWADLTVSLIRTADGRPDFFISVVQDVSDRKRAEQEVRRLNAELNASLQELQTILDTAPVGINVAKDPGCKVIVGNPALAAMLGMAAGENVSKSRDDAEALPYRILKDGNDAPAETLPMQRAAATGRPVEDDPYEIVRADGGRLQILVRANPVKDATGEVTGAVGVCVEVTERKRAELKLREGAERLQAALDAASTGTFRWEFRSDALVWDENLDRLFGLPPGRTARSLDAFIAMVHPEDRAGVIERCRRCASEGSDFVMEFRVVWPDGSVHWLYDQGKTFFDGQGRPLYMTGACVDVTGRKLAEAERERLLDELKLADRRKDEFLAVLAHELRNPLAAVGNALKVLDRSGEEDAGRWARDVVTRQTGQLARLVDDLLDVARISQGKIRLKTERLDAVAAVQKAVQTARAAFDAKGQALTAALPGGPVWVEADPARLEQMVVNLLTNAAKYTDPGGRVGLRAEAEGGRLLISIRDSGVGIAADMLTRIFEPFAQVDASLERSQGGLGIGLSLVRTLAELHGGAVTATSEGPGRGSEFTLRLPTAAPPPRPRRDEPVRPAGPSGGLRVLAVDDNADSLAGVTRLLRLSGYEVDSAPDGAAALEKARGCRPDVVLLDIGLPGMDGYQVAARLRSDPASGAVKLVALSGYGQDDDRRRSREAGFDAHLVKPVEVEELLALLEKLVCEKPRP